MIFNPVFASKSAISFAGIGAAPHSANSRLEMSAPAIGTFIKAEKIVGTPENVVTR